MPDVLIARRALGTREGEALREFGCVASVRLTERPLEPVLELQFDDGDGEAATVLASATGLALTAAHRSVAAAATTAMRLGPGDWLIKPGADSAASLAVLESAVATTRASLVDVSDLWFGVRVEGAHSRDVLAKGCAIDLDLQVFGPGATAVTQLARLRTLIHHVDGPLVYDVYVERSYARYLWAWLADAANEFLDTEGTGS